MLAGVAAGAGTRFKCPHESPGVFGLMLVMGKSELRPPQGYVLDPNAVCCVASTKCRTLRKLRNLQRVSPEDTAFMCDALLARLDRLFMSPVRLSLVFS